MHRALRIAFLLASFFALTGNVGAQVTANFTASPTSGCAPLVVYFTNTTTGNATSWSWDFGNTTTSVLQHPSTSYTSPGTYTVRLTSSGPGGTNTITKTAFITVYPPPTVSFTYNNSAGCAPHTVQFTSSVTPNSPGSVTYYWDFGDGFNASSANPSHTYNTSGTYSVTLTVTNGNGCSKTVVQTNIITVYPKPTGSFYALPTTYCQVPATVSFYSSASGTGSVNVSWDFGDGSGTTGNSPTHTYTTPGTYTVKMYMSDSRGCKDSLVQPAYITAHSSAATFTAPTSICQSSLYVPPPSSPLVSPWFPVSYHLHGSTLPATFTNTTSGATLAHTYWDFGDGHHDTGGTVSHAFYTAGRDTVRMITEVGGCLDTVYHVIVVNPYSNTGFTYAPFPNCPAPVTIQFTGTGASSYQWTWSRLNSSTVTTSSSGTPSRTYTSDGFVEEVRVIGTNSFGCIDTLVATDSIFNMFVSYVGAIKGCAPLTLTDTMILNTSITKNKMYPGYTFPGTTQTIITSFYWDFGDGTSSSAQFPTHTYTKPGIYPRVLKITTANGCTLYDTVLIHVGSKVKPSFIINPDSVCTNTQVYFTNTTPRAASGSLTYTWDVGNIYTPVNNRDAIATYFRPGQYNVVLYADSNGCEDSTMCINCLTILPPNANFTDSLYCSPWNTTVLFIDSSVGATTRLWNFGDGNTSTATSPVHTYATTGNYNVTLITHNNITGCSDTMTQPLLLPPITINFVAADTTVCRGDMIVLTPSYSGPAWKSSYEWYFDNGSMHPDSLLRPMVYSAESIANDPLGISNPVNGFHSITFKVIRANLRGGYCIDTFRRNNYVLISRPAPAFAGLPILGCTPLQVNFSDSSTFTTGTAPANRTWTFGDGGTASNNNQTTSHIYTKAGVYSVKLKVTDWNGCADSLTRYGYVQARHPTADFSVSKQNACVGDVITFTNLSFGATSLSYKWSFGDGDTAVSLGPTHSYTTPGSYAVRLIVTDSTGCSDTLTKAAHITITRPVASFTLSDTLSVCPPLTVRFTSTSTNATMLAWNFGNTGTATIPNPSSTYLNPGVYLVRLIATDAAGCPDTATARVRVLGYAGALSYTPLSGCAPLEVKFTANITNVPSLVWDFSDGSTLPATGATASHVYATPGSYVPKLIFSAGTGCTSASVGLDTIRVDDVIAGFKVFPPCEKTTLQLIDTSRSYFSGIKDSRWDFGGSGIAFGNPVQRSYPAAGTYPVTLITTNTNGCKDTLTKNITIYPLPHVLLPPDTAVCVPDAISITATGAATYAWSPGTALSCTACASPMASPTAPAMYIVTGTDTNGCVGKDTIRIGIQTKSTFVTNKSGEICLGQQYKLFAGGATVYNWTPAGSLDDPNLPNPVATPKVTTTYIVTGKEGSCVADTHSIQVIVRPLPVVDAGGDLRVVAGNGVLLQASGTGITKIAWKDDPSLSCFSCYAPEARPKITTTYFLTAYNEYGCTATDSVRVYVLCDGSQLFIPNTFSPNGDGNNDFFFPRGQGIDHINSFRVYSRWGELLFERSNISVNDEYNGWNGTSGSRKLNPDVYVYVIEATCDTGEPILFKGDITLLR